MYTAGAVFGTTNYANKRGLYELFFLTLTHFLIITYCHKGIYEKKSVGGNGCRKTILKNVGLSYYGSPHDFISLSEFLFLLHFLLQAFVQQGHDLVEIAHHTEVGHTEDGGALVAADGDDEVGLRHALCRLTCYSNVRWSIRGSTKTKYGSRFQHFEFYYFRFPTGTSLQMKKKGF